MFRTVIKSGCCSALNGSIDGQEFGPEGFELGEGEGVGAVGQGLVGVGVGFHEDACDARGDGGAGEQGDVFALAARAFAKAAGLLDGMGCIEDHRAAGLGHDRQAAHVGNQRVVAERGAPFAQQEGIGIVAGGLRGVACLGDDLLHVGRGHELGLLDVHRLARGGNGGDEIGLPGKEGGRLEDIDHLRDGFGLACLVHVGQHGQARFGADLFEDAQAFIHARAAKRLVRAAVGLVEGTFEDQRYPKAAGDLSQGFGNREGEGLALDDAGPGNREEPGRGGDRVAAKDHGKT